MAAPKHSPRKGGLLSAKGQSWYILAGLSVVVAVLLYPHALVGPGTYRLGEVADRDIKAVREFLIENAELTEKNRVAAVKEVLAVYDFEKTAQATADRVRKAFSEARAALAEAMAAGRSAESGEAGNQASRRLETLSADIGARFFESLELKPNPAVLEPLLTNGFPPAAEEAVVRIAVQLLETGVVSNREMLMTETDKGVILHDITTEKERRVADLGKFYDLKAVEDFLKTQRRPLEKTLGSPEMSAACLQLVAGLIKPNITMNKRETELRKEAARKSVKPFYFKVKKGEMLIREGERVAPEHLLKLSEQQRFLRSRKLIGRIPAMAVLLGFMLGTLHLAGLMDNRRARTRPRDTLFLALTVLVMFLMVAAANFMANETARGLFFVTPRALIFAVPVASGAMLLSVFQGIPPAAAFSLVAALLGSFVQGGGLELFVYFFVGSLVAAHGVRKGRERGIFIKAGLLVSASNMVMALCIQALNGPLYSLETAAALASAFAGGILVGIIATGILPLAEMAFGYTSDIKLLELANLDQPLLRELMVQAPGTYHHSVIVSNMVEASARAIDANPLLAKVAAYYHDIGKMLKPHYFIENQMDRENRHERLAPSMSSLILISHVKDGVELARRNKLGQEIVDIIRQHHGTSLITYFYEKAKEQKERKAGKTVSVAQEDFRYPGPKPQTKEAGLVMLADVVEAAARTISDPTAARIQGMVQRIINKVFSDGQLDECELTLKDLNAIARSFNKTLAGILHQRIDYPEPVIKSAEGRKGTDGYPDQVPGADTPGRKASDREESRDSLRRLGLSR